jgi:hypothetical protein
VITVVDVNDLPTATASTSSGNEDTDIAVALAGTDIDGTIASVTVTVAAASQRRRALPRRRHDACCRRHADHGSAGRVSLIFTPAANFNGTVTIAFTVTDDDGGTSAPANEVITGHADVNDLPTADGFDLER